MPPLRAPLVLALGLAACRGETHARAEPTPPPRSPAEASVAAAPGPSAREDVASSASASSLSPPDPENRTKPPLASEDLTERASHLLDALVKGDAALADDFFFPKEPFLPLKDVADPGRYFDQLLATYHRDITAIRKTRKSWEGATMVSFELGSAPGWVAPGKEYNKIGYFRTFHGKLRYAVGGAAREIVVTTIISWGGRWYVTHLAPIQH
jgi:hypothetical protein